MEILNCEEMLQIDGGGFNFGLWYLAFGIFSFIVGVYEGLVNPRRCNR